MKLFYLIVSTCIFCMSSPTHAKSQYMSSEEMVACVIEFSFPTYHIDDNLPTPAWFKGKIPISRFNPLFKSELLKIIELNNKLKGKDRKLTKGSLIMLGYMADKEDIKYLDRYMQEGISLIKANPELASSLYEPIDFMDIGRCLGIMIARNIEGSKEFYLKYGTRDIWEKLHVSKEHQMNIVGHFASAVYVMSKYDKARKIGLEYFYVRGRDRRAVKERVFDNIDKKYKVNKYTTLLNSSNYRTPSLMQAFTRKMKEYYPDMFAYFGINVKTSIKFKQKKLEKKKDLNSKEIPQ